MENKEAQELQNIFNILAKMSNTEKGVSIAMMLGHLEIIKNTILLGSSRISIKNMIMESKNG